MYTPKAKGGEEIYGFRRAPWSLPVHLIYALHEAVQMVLEEGLEARVNRHQVVGQMTREAIRAMGLQLFAQTGSESPTVTAFMCPDGVSIGEVIKRMRDKYNVIIGGGLEDLAGKIGRIGHMGVLANPQPLRMTICALGYSLRELGCEVDVETALKIFG